MELEEADEIVRLSQPWPATVSQQGLISNMFYAQIEQMEVEVQTVAKEHKTKLQIKLRSYKSDIARFKSDVVRWEQSHIP